MRLPAGACDPGDVGERASLHGACEDAEPAGPASVWEQPDAGEVPEWRRCTSLLARTAKDACGPALAQRCDDAAGAGAASLLVVVAPSLSSSRSKLLLEAAWVRCGVLPCAPLPPLLPSVTAVEGKDGDVEAKRQRRGTDAAAAELAASTASAVEAAPAPALKGCLPNRCCGALGHGRRRSGRSSPLSATSPL